MALTFSLLFTYHIGAAACGGQRARHAAPPIIQLFIAQAVASVLLTFAPMHVLYCLFFSFSNLQALLIYSDAAHDLIITRGVKDVRGGQKLNLHKLFLFLCSCDTGLNSKCCAIKCASAAVVACGMNVL